MFNLFNGIFKSIHLICLNIRKKKAQSVINSSTTSQIRKKANPNTNRNESESHLVLKLKILTLQMKVVYFFMFFLL